MSKYSIFTWPLLSLLFVNVCFASYESDDEEMQMAKALSVSTSHTSAVAPATSRPSNHDDEDLAIALSMSEAEAKETKPILSNNDNILGPLTERLRIIDQTLKGNPKEQFKYSLIAIKEEITQTKALIATIPSTAQELQEQIKGDAVRLEQNYGGQKQHQFLHQSVEYKKNMLASLTIFEKTLNALLFLKRECEEHLLSLE